MERSLPPREKYSFSPYVRAIAAYPFLTAHEEQKLCYRWRDHHDISAAHKLVGCHLRLVLKIAKGYRHYGFSLDDLVGEGHVGLMRAICRFDPDRGARFSTYAKWWVMSAMQEYVLHNWSLVKIGTTDSQKKLFFNLRRMLSNIEEFESGNLKTEQIRRIATILKVPPHEVVAMNQRVIGHDLSLNAPLSSDTETEWQTLLVDDRDDPEATLIHSDEIARKRSLVIAALVELTERERQIIVERRLRTNPMRLKTLSLRYGVSIERVRQIETRAWTKLQQAVRVQAVSGIAETHLAAKRISVHPARRRARSVLVVSTVLSERSELQAPKLVSA
jgi:RNA polymerase sigma-32 factor